jgi:hypothetical protein
MFSSYIYPLIADIMDYTSERQALIHRGFVVAYALSISEILQDEAKDMCPIGKNFINPHTHEFIHVEAIDSNFSGYVAMLKLGEPVINRKDEEFLKKWKKYVEDYPPLTVSRNEMLAYLDSDIDDDFILEVYSLLIEIDYLLF